MAPGKAAKQLKELQNLARNAKESEKCKVTDTSLALVDHFLSTDTSLDFEKKITK
jgi:hypothetical protein